MAVPTGSGTETLHSHAFSDADNAGGGRQSLIIGVQHHIYTVLSIIIHCNALNATTDQGYLMLSVHDGHAGTSDVEITFATVSIQVEETYVWNDKFSFNGYEPSGTNVMSASEQIAIAAQGGGVVQEMLWKVDNAADDMDLIVTYLDQDWS